MNENKNIKKENNKLIQNNKNLEKELNELKLKYNNNLNYKGNNINIIDKNGKEMKKKN